MKQTWFTCSRCGQQFKGAANHNHHCPRCHHYPSLAGKVKLQPQQPRVTRQFSPPTPSGTFPQFTSSDPPTQPGQFTQAGWPPTQPLPPRRKSPGQIFREASPAGKIGIGCVGVAVIVLVLACCGGIAAAINGNNQTANATPTPGTVAQAGNTPTTQATQAQATPTATPRPPTPTLKPKPTATPTKKPGCPFPAVNNNPYCFTFHNTGKLIYNPPGDFCSYFPCIGTFGNSAGYVVECADGDYSTAGGISGACSHHGGVNRPLYAP